MLPVWRVVLQEKLLQLRKAIKVPQDFPMWRTLRYYGNPTASTPEQLLDLRGLRHGWDRSIGQNDLRSFLRERFHFTTQEFLKHIDPTFVKRRLARAHADRREANRELGILLKRTRKKNDVEDVDDRAEAKVTFSLLAVVDIDPCQRPDEEDWTDFAAKDGTPYDSA
jgi:holliday junction resolvase YEN1